MLRRTEPRMTVTVRLQARTVQVIVAIVCPTCGCVSATSNATGGTRVIDRCAVSHCHNTHPPVHGTTLEAASMECTAEVLRFPVQASWSAGPWRGTGGTADDRRSPVRRRAVVEQVRVGAR